MEDTILKIKEEIDQWEAAKPPKFTPILELQACTMCKSKYAFYFYDYCFPCIKQFNITERQQRRSLSQ